MTQAAEHIGTSLERVDQSRVITIDPESETRGMEESFVETLMDYYDSFQFGTGHDRMLKDTADIYLRNPDNIPAQSLLMQIIRRHGITTQDPDFMERSERAYATFKAEAFARSYVKHVIDSIITDRDSSLTRAQIIDRSKTLEMIRNDLNTKVVEDDVEYVGPRYHYSEVSHIIWTGRQTAWRKNRYAEAQAIHEVHKEVSPSVDHPTTRAVSLAAELSDKIETNENFNLNELRRLSQLVDAEVPPNVRRLSKTADSIYRAVSAQIVERKIFHDVAGNAEAADIYDQMLKIMHAEVVIVAKFEDVETPADMFGDDVVSEVIHEEYPDSDAPIVEVVSDPETTKINGVKVVVTKTAYRRATGMAAAVASAAVVGGLFAYVNAPQDAKDKDIAALSPEVRTSDQTGNTADAGEVLTPDSIMTTEPSVDGSTPTTIVPPIPPEIGTPKPHKPRNHGNAPTAQEVKNANALSTVAISTESTPQLVQPENAHAANVAEVLETYNYQGTFQNAKTAYTEVFLDAKPDAAANADQKFVERSTAYIEMFDGKLKEYLASGNLKEKDYVDAHQLLLKAAVASNYPGLVGELGLDKLARNDYINTVIDHSLLTSGNLGTSTDKATLDVVSLAVANAFAIITPEKQQIAYIQEVTGVEPTTTTEEPEIEVTTEPPEENKDDNKENGTKNNENNNNNEENPNNGGNSENNNGNNNENNNNNETNTSTQNLSEIEKSALARMEQIGPMWRNRAIVMRGLMSRGWTAVQVSGIIGNASVEAAGPELDPKIKQYGGGPGRGIIQWGSFDQAFDRFGHEAGAESRVGTLKWYAAQNKLAWTDLQAQIGFIDWELRNSEKAAGDALRGAKTPQEAAEIIVFKYERPADPQASLGQRIGYARGTFAEFQELVDNKEPGEFDNKYRNRAVLESYLSDKYGEVSGQLVPADLTVLGEKWGSARLFRDAAFSFRMMSAAFEAEFNRPLSLSGGADDAYRDLEAQRRLYADKPDLAAKPGTSNHGWGLAADFGGGINSGPGSKEFEWMVDHAGEFGWGQYDWAKPGGSKPEAWHWEYMVGVPGISGDKLKPQTATPEVETPPKAPEVLVSKQGYALPISPSLYGTLGTLYLGYSNPAELGNHTGWDFEVPTGTPVNPVKPGKVIKVTPADSSGGAGNTLFILHDDGTSSDYQHMSSIGVSVGDRVELGDVVGKSGNTGFSSGEHLHLTLHEKGYVDYASRHDSVEEVQKQTINPADVMPTPQEVNEWLKSHASSRLAGSALSDAVELTEIDHEPATEALDPSHTHNPSTPTEEESTEEEATPESPEETTDEPTETIEEPIETTSEVESPSTNSHDEQHLDSTAVTTQPVQPLADQPIAEPVD